MEIKMAEVGGPVYRFKPGELALMHGVGHILKVKVVGRRWSLESRGWQVVVKVTAPSGWGYTRGEALELMASSVVPRGRWVGMVCEDSLVALPKVRVTCEGKVVPV